MTIHILGTGAVGCQVASVLRSHKNKVTLLLRSPSHLKDFQARKNIINYQLKGKSNLIDGFEANLIGDKTITSPISSLIVATKAHHTLDAVLPMTSRLSSKSTILLLQNGVGVAEELVKKLWPNEQPPTIMVGVNRHAVERTAPYEVCHHSGYEDPDALNIGIFPIPGQQSNSDNELAKTIVGIPDFKAKLLSWQEMRVKILRKLVVNSSINAVASVLTCKNKGVLNPGGIAMMQSVCEEAYSVMKDELPEESVESLMNLVLDTSHEAGENVCSTLQDIRDKRLTEIDYLNGYICKLGKEQNIDTKTNQALVHLIHAREALYSTM